MQADVQWLAVRRVDIGFGVGFLPEGDINTEIQLFLTQADVQRNMEEHQCIGLCEPSSVRRNLILSRPDITKVLGTIGSEWTFDR